MNGAPTFLDAGCGNGSYAVSQSWHDEYDYTGVDVDPGEVVEAQSRGLNAQEGDVHDLDFADDEFDRIVAKAVLEHVEDPLRATQELRRVLTPGGSLTVIVPSDRSYDVWGDYTHLRAFRRDALIYLLVDAGFDRASIGVSGRMGWASPGMALKSVARIIAPWTPYGYPRAWVAEARW